MYYQKGMLIDTIKKKVILNLIMVVQCYTICFGLSLEKPSGANNPVGAIKSLIEDKHKDYKTFKDSVIASAMTIQGSGWVYLSKKGEIKTTPNQSYKTDILMPIDMWEHSFTDYVPAKDAKKKYIAGIMRLINWDIINQRMS